MSIKAERKIKEGGGHEEEGEHESGPVSGLDFHVSFQHQHAEAPREASVSEGQIIDNGDGSYTWTRTFTEPGVYIITAWFEQEGIKYFSSFPLEVSKAGGERIYNTPGCADSQNCEYNYQIRWENTPGHIHADGTEILFNIEIKRSLGPLNYEMPFRNIFDHLVGQESNSNLWIDPVITIEGPETIRPVATYKGLGVWEIIAIFNESGDYQLHIEFVDPDGYSIDETGEDFAFHVSEVH